MFINRQVIISSGEIQHEVSIQSEHHPYPSIILDKTGFTTNITSPNV